jgi:hypothetical protein
MNGKISRPAQYTIIGPPLAFLLFAHAGLFFLQAHKSVLMTLIWVVKLIIISSNEGGAGTESTEF